MTKSSEPMVDPGQGVRIVFLGLGGTQLELIEPTGPESPVAKRVLKSPDCFISASKSMISTKHCVDWRLPGSDDHQAAVTRSSNRPSRVAFVVTTGNDLIEFVERQTGGET